MAKKVTSPKKETRKAPKAPQNPPVDQEAVSVETVETAQVINVENLRSTKKSGLSPDALATTLNLASKHLTGPNAVAKYGAQIEDKMDRIVAAGVVSLLAEHAMNSDDTFAAVLQSNAYPMLLEVATSMGIKLPEQKLLTVNNEGKVEIPSSAVEVSEETAEQIAEEAEITEQGDTNKIELDPVKVAHMSEDDLKKALKYLFVTKPKREKFTVKDTLTSVVDFMHDYRIEQARQAENSTEAMNKLEDRNMYEWLTDIRQYVEPTIIAKGIGIGLVNLTGIEKSPLSAFLTLRGTLIDKETKKPVWDDQSIAYATRFFIEFICNSEIAKEQNAIDNLDSKSEGYKEIVAKHQSVIDRYNKVLDYVNNISFDITETLTESEDTAIIKAMNRIKTQYYPECDMAVPNSKYIGLVENLRQRSGIILNLFLPSTEYNKNFSESNLIEVKEISADEWQKMQEEKRKQATAEKKAKSKNA